MPPRCPSALADPLGRQTEKEMAVSGMRDEKKKTKDERDGESPWSGANY